MRQPSAPAAQISCERTGILLRGIDFDIHNGFEKHGVGFFHPLFEGDAAGCFEGHFRGVDRVIASVVEDHPEIDHRIACQEPFGCRVDNSFFHCRYEISGNGSSEDFVDELELPASRQRLQLDLARVGNREPVGADRDLPVVLFERERLHRVVAEMRR